jgi:hypothetical protein
MTRWIAEPPAHSTMVNKSGPEDRFDLDQSRAHRLSSLDPRQSNPRLGDAK